ncbi:MAG: V-type ATPase subunit [Candidatus Micrarchaeota archaeon]
MDLRYAYANARVKGMKSNLLGENVFRELMQVKTMEEITALLEQTPYKQDLVEASKNHTGVQVIDVALHNNMARTISTVARIMPSHGRGLFALLNAEWDAQNLKRVLSKKAFGRETTEADLLGVSPARKSFYARLLKTKSLQEALELVSAKWGSKKFRMKIRGLASSKQEEALRNAIGEIEKERVRQLLVLSQTAGDPLVKKIIEDRLVFENVMVVLRLKKEGVKNAGSFVLFKSPLVNRLLQTESFEECLKETANAFSLQPEVAERAKSSLSVLEIALERKIVERVLRWTRLSVLSFATVVGFVFLKGVEVSNLRKIAFANAFDLKQELGEYIFAINA